MNWDGSIKHVQITSNANFGEMGFKNTRCFTVDVTDEVAASAAARQTEQNARDILDALPAAIYTTDAEGRVTFFNEAAVAFSGRRPEIGSDQWCVAWRLYEPDGTPLPHDQCPMAVRLEKDVRYAVGRRRETRWHARAFHALSYPSD